MGLGCSRGPTAVCKRACSRRAGPEGAAADDAGVALEGPDPPVLAGVGVADLGVALEPRFFLLLPLGFGVAGGAAGEALEAPP